MSRNAMDFIDLQIRGDCDVEVRVELAALDEDAFARSKIDAGNIELR